MTYSTEWTYVVTRLFQNGATQNAVLAELPFHNVNFQSRLNGIGSFQGELLLSGVNYNSISLNISSDLAPGWAALYVLHKGTPVWGGVIWGRSWDSETQTLTINANEMLSYFQHRRIDSALNAAYGGTSIVYTAKDVLYVVNDLLTYSEGCLPNGKIGLAYSGLLTSGYNITRTYYNFELKSIYEAWRDLATGAIGGSGVATTSLFDFMIQPSMVGGYITNTLITGTPTIGKTYSAASTTSVNLQFPGNIVSYTYAEDGATVANYLYGLGYGANGNKIISKVKAGNLLGTGLFPSSSPLLQDTVSFIDVKDTTLLGQLTSGRIAATAVPPTTVQVTVPSYIDPQYNQTVSTAYNLGDEVNLMIQDDRFPNVLQGTYRIMAIEVTPGENGPDKVILTLNLPLQSNVS